MCLELSRSCRQQKQHLMTICIHCISIGKNEIAHSVQCSVCQRHSPTDPHCPFLMLPLPLPLLLLLLSLFLPRLSSARDHLSVLSAEESQLLCQQVAIKAQILGAEGMQHGQQTRAAAAAAEAAGLKVSKHIGLGPRVHR